MASQVVYSESEIKELRNQLVLKDKELELKNQELQTQLLLK
jgi:hypothetical protein